MRNRNFFNAFYLVIMLYYRLKFLFLESYILNMCINGDNWNVTFRNLCECHCVEFWRDASEWILSYILRLSYILVGLPWCYSSHKEKFINNHLKQWRIYFRAFEPFHKGKYFHPLITLLLPELRNIILVLY